MESLELRRVAGERNEVPEFVATLNGSPDAPELWRFLSDRAEVIVTNAGVVVEGEDGFADLRARIMA